VLKPNQKVKVLSVVLQYLVLHKHFYLISESYFAII
jgi:hypothetical protein